MTKLEQAARQALGVLEKHVESFDYEHFTSVCELDPAKDTILILREALAEQAECKECGANQAQIDRLMLEYCPEEMTIEKLQKWGNSQRPVEQAEQEPVAWMDTLGELHKHKLQRDWQPVYAATVTAQERRKCEQEMSLIEEHCAELILIEREACAKLLDEMAAQDRVTNYYKVAAKAIRARSEK